MTYTPLLVDSSKKSVELGTLDTKKRTDVDYEYYGSVDILDPLRYQKTSPLYTNPLNVLFHWSFNWLPLTFPELNNLLTPTHEKTTL
jgi:hypothetical protein